MRVVWWGAAAAVALVCGCAAPASAQARVEEAQARRLGAEVRYRDNPVVDVDLGPRNGRGRQTWDYAIGVGQVFETGGQRRARIAAADADVGITQASADDTVRRLAR